MHFDAVVALVLNRRTEKTAMKEIRLSPARMSYMLGILKVIASVVLLAALSWEVLHGYRLHFSPLYLEIQLCVCLLFLFDLFVRWVLAEGKWSFFVRNLPVLIISVPYLNLLDWTGFMPGREAAMLIGIMPLARAFLAMIIVVNWLVNGGIKRLLTAYLLVMVVFTYLAALVFYDFESARNVAVDSFGNAMWWAWANLVTIGSPIEAVTVVGKVLTVLLPVLGMALLPIFTTFVSQEYDVRRQAAQKKSGR